MFPSTAHRFYPKRLILGGLVVLGLLAGYLLLPQGTLHAQAENTHTVSPGDTLTNIADRYGMTVEELVAINELRNPNIVYIGQELIVSSEANPAEAEAETESAGAEVGDAQTAITSTVTITGTTDSSSITETVDLTATQAVTVPAVISTEVTAPAATAITATTPTTVTTPLTTSAAATATLAAAEGVTETVDGASATAAISTTTYTVQRGETLYMIAARFDTTPEVIAALNGLRNANLLYVGQELLVPFVEREEEAEPTPTPTVELIEPTPTIELIEPTPTLIPPSPTPEPSPTATATSTPEPTPTATPEPEELTTTYTVRTGDNLSSIAARFDTTTDELLRLNGLANANYVYVGQRLRVPIIRDPNAPLTVDPTRISFPAGGTAASVDGTVIFPDQACYILEAVAGQEMTVAVDSDGDLANFLVRAADSGVNGGVPLKRLENEERRWSYALPVTGDYLICVATPEGAALYQLTVSIPAACISVTQAIQTVDWEPFLQSDTALTHEDIGGDDYVTVAATAMTDTIATGGIPQIDQIVYGDFDGDCEEEAGVPLFSGGTAGNVGYLVYDAQTDDAGVTTPVLVTWGDGYKLGLTADGGILIVSNALYNGWEPNCCPSGRSYDSYRLTDGTLTLLATTTEGFVEAQVPTVLQFYDLLQSGSYTEAYAFLSPTLQAENPYESWVAGYANTEAIDATIEPDLEIAGRVLADLQVTERLSSGTARIRHYTGYWDLVWDGSIPGWILQDGSFTVVP